MKLGEILMGQKPDSNCGVYLIKTIRPRSETIYVGSSRTIARRLRYHHKQDNSPLWQEICEFLPMSLAWHVVILPFENDDLVDYKMRKKEAELIAELIPYLNEYMQPEELR